MPRAKGQSSLSDNEMQLAIALSSSLEESKKLELSNLTEALPASAIEDGTVPKSIKQMQKEFFERLKLPKPGPSNKSKKPTKPVPTLLVRSPEERLRIITEKVALVFIKDESTPSSANDGDNLELVQDDGQATALWNLSWMLSSDKNLYYVDCLATFISPSEAKTGPKLSNSILVPGKLTTPINYSLNRESLHHNESLPNEEHEISSCYEEEEDYMDPDFQAQSEHQNDWQRMLNNPKLSDITIVVKERSHVFAHKLVLFVRCPAVIEDLDDKNMLYWRTVAHSQAMAFLEYLYSGKLSGIRVLGGSVDGVVFLARKYKVTELLKFLLISDFGVEVSDPTNWHIPSCSSIVKAPMKSGATSPDLFADPEETICTTNYTSSEPQISIEISSDEEGETLLKEFFGTYNPTVSSPILKSDSESDKELLDRTPMGVLKQPVSSGTKLFESFEEKRYYSKRQYRSGSDEDLFSSPKACARIAKHGQSPETCGSKNDISLSTNVLYIESSSDEEFSETVNARIITESGYSFSPFKVSPLVIADGQSSSKGTRKSLFQSSQEKYFDDDNKSNSRNLSFVDDAAKDISCICSTPCAKRKLSKIDEINKHSSFYKRRRALNKSVSLSSFPKFDTASCSDQNLSKDLDDSFNSIRTRNFKHTFETKNVNSPNKVGKLDFKESDYNFSFPNKQGVSSSSANYSGNGRKLLDDSFQFDINDSVLLKHTDGMQTPESKGLRLAQLRTPLDSVKTSSPITPMPEYWTMTNEEFEMELQTFGLKRGMSRSKGIKMLTYIYGQLHPLVEVVSCDGKERLIPLAERTVGNEVSSDDEPSSQQSVGSSGNNCIMLEETIFDEEEDLTQGVSSKDLKTAVRTWITSRPEIHEMILSYEPIWLDSFHIELKSQFDKKITVNQLMDVLDEEGITFRSAQGQQNRRKKRNSPKKP